jgi:hypothetical protein
MPRTRTTTEDKTTKVAEGIGRALAKLVNRLGSLDAEREKAYTQLLALQARLNTQVTRLGRTIGQKARTVAKRQAPGRPAGKGRLPGPPATRRPRATPAAATRTRTKKTVTCSVCGTRGHNARGHAKWQASKNR